MEIGRRNICSLNGLGRGLFFFGAASLFVFMAPPVFALLKDLLDDVPKPRGWHVGSFLGDAFPVGVPKNEKLKRGALDFQTRGL